MTGFVDRMFISALGEKGARATYLAFETKGGRFELIEAMDKRGIYVDVNTAQLPVYLRRAIWLAASELEFNARVSTALSTAADRLLSEDWHAEPEKHDVPDADIIAATESLRRLEIKLEGLALEEQLKEQFKADLDLVKESLQRGAGVKRGQADDAVDLRFALLEMLE